MELAPFVDAIRRELAVAAEAGGPDARALAERLSAPLESAVRLTLLDALSAASAEITRDLAPGSVDLRLRGREPTFVVTPPPTDNGFDERGLSDAPVPISDDGDAAMVRINLRLAEDLKSRVEDAARTAGLSVNAWLVRAAAAAAESEGTSRQSGRHGPQGGERYTGWVR